MASEHYCIWGLCDLQEYCCGQNVCCKSNETESNSLFLAVIILGTLIMAALCCTYIYYNRKWFDGLLFWNYLKRYMIMSKTSEKEMGSADICETFRIQQTSNNYIVQINEEKALA